MTCDNDCEDNGYSGNDYYRNDCNWKRNGYNRMIYCGMIDTVGTIIVDKRGFE